MNNTAIELAVNAAVGFSNTMTLIESAVGDISLGRVARTLSNQISAEEKERFINLAKELERA